MPAETLTISFEGKTFAIDDFELGELEWLEDELGGTLDEINPNSMKAAVRFVTILKRRENPEFSIDDARKLKLSIFDEASENGNAERPTKPARKRKAAG